MDLEKFRKELDIIDGEIIELLAKRFRVIDRISEHKKQMGIPIVQEERMQKIFKRVEIIAIKHGLDKEFTRSLFEKIINEAIKRERR